MDGLLNEPLGLSRSLSAVWPTRTFSTDYGNSAGNRFGGKDGHEARNEKNRSPEVNFTVLVVDDEPSVAESHVSLLTELSFKAEFETDPLKVEKLLVRRPDIGLVILDIRMPELNGCELLRRIRTTHPHVGVIMATVINDIEEAVKATRNGAYNYLLKPLHPDRLHTVLRSFLENQPRRLLDDPRCSLFITNSPLCEDVFRRAKAFAASDAPVLIQGETGVGKELVAQILHLLSGRNAQPFVGVNVAALSSTIFESELFGHVRGAFTGAVRDRDGYIAHASTGTLFLDEIGELSLEQQKKILRVLQTKIYSRVGETRERPVDARLLFATNRDLLAESKQDSFRADLYYRFSGHTITIPPLRKRPEDIELLANYFLQKYCSQYGRIISGFTSGALEVLRRYPFPGNVRELDGCVSAAVLLEQSSTIREETLPRHMLEVVDDNATDLESLRYQTIMRTLAECDGNQTKAAGKLGIARGTLNRLLKTYRSRDSRDS